MIMPAVVVLMIVGIVMTVVMMIMVARFTVRVIVGAEVEGALPIDEIEAADEKHPDSGKEGVDAKTRVEVFFNPPRHIEVEEDSAPGEERENGQNLKNFFHGSEKRGSKTNPEVAE